MNNRTVRLLRKYALTKKISERDAKQSWQRLPRPYRREARQVMLQELRELE